MSIEDINYLRNNSIKQHYTFIIDSVDRDRYKYPNPNKYVIEFNVPFKNVIGLEIIDSSIPRTMYNIDYENNLIYYYIGKKNNDYNIINGIKEIENETNLLINCDFSDDGYAIIENNKYIELNNNINLYNIYKNGGIGGDNIGITFSFKIKVTSNISNIINVNEKYYILNMGYYHLHLIDDLDNPKIGRYLYSGILVYIKKNIVTPSLYDIYFVIGYDNSDAINIKEVIQGVNLEIENHICWTISENNDWRIYISTKSELYTKVNNYKSINNVFYTEKNIGRECNNTFNNLTKISELTYKYGWNNNIKLHIKDFKIYNKVLTGDDIEMCKNNTMNMKNLPIWYKLDSNNINDNKLNSGSSKFINYEDIFIKFSIEEGDYTFKSFLTKYDKTDTYEIGFKKHTDPAEVSNLIDIYSMNPFIIDMKKSTISENLGFDLYANAVPEHNNVRYINKPINNTNEKMMKMFYSVNITIHEKQVSNVGVYDNYIVTSPGIVYFIGNKYILLRCPEIEEHLFGSLSYSKYSLGLAKFRVDNVGINTERLVITKLPVREFHPIGKLSRLTLIFETSRGTLYDFKGVNHNITFAVYYFEPTQNKFPEGSILNPEYKMNYMEYKYYEEEIEGDSDEEEIDEYSRDNIDDYIKKENEYSNEGMENKKYREYYEN
jgi:hypothetical protein